MAPRYDDRSTHIYTTEHSSKTQSFTLDTKVPTEQNHFDSKMPNRCLHVYSAQITSLQLSEVTLEPEFNFDNVTYINTSISSIMFYYFEEI